MHFQGHFVPGKRFTRNQIMMITFHKDETYFSRISLAAKGAGGESNKKKTPREKPKCLVEVEIDGVEPTTLCLQSRCSSQLSYIPKIW